MTLRVQCPSVTHTHSSGVYVATLVTAGNSVYLPSMSHQLWGQFQVKTRLAECVPRERGVGSLLHSVKQRG